MILLISSIVLYGCGKASNLETSTLSKIEAQRLVERDWDEDSFSYDSSTIEISKITSYQNGYLFLMKYSGEGETFNLYYVTPKANDWDINTLKTGVPALSAGVSVNATTLNGNSIVFGNVLDSYFDKNEKQISVKFEKVEFYSSDNKLGEVSVNNNETFLYIIKDKSSVTKWKSFNKEKNLIIDSDSLNNYYGSTINVID